MKNRVVVILFFASAFFFLANYRAKANEEGHGHEVEENSQVGPDKGIVEATEDEGFKLSPEAEKNFEIKKTKIRKAGSVEISKSAIVTSGDEVNVYRIRAGFYKRIDFVQLKTSKDKVEIQSHDLAAGDEIAIAGLGFLRLAEITAFGGGAEGHSH